VIALVKVNVAAHIVTKTNAPVDAIISWEDVMISAKIIVRTLHPQAKADRRIVFFDGLNLLWTHNSKIQGTTYTTAIRVLAVKPAVTMASSGLKLKKAETIELT
jgi:hypothetical protein